MGFSEQCIKNNIIFRHIGILKPVSQQEHFNHDGRATIIFMTNGSSNIMMPYSQSVCAHGKAVVLDITVSEP